MKSQIPIAEREIEVDGAKHSVRIFAAHPGERAAAAQTMVSRDDSRGPAQRFLRRQRRFADLRARDIPS